MEELGPEKIAMRFLAIHKESVKAFKAPERLESKMSADGLMVGRLKKNTFTLAHS